MRSKTRSRSHSITTSARQLATVLTVALFAVMMIGCAASKDDIIRFQEDHSEFRARMVQMDDQLEQIEADIDSLRALLGENVSQSLRAIRAEQGATNQQLERRLINVSTRLEQNEQRMSRLMTELERLSRALQRYAPAGEAAAASDEERSLYEQSQADYSRGEYELARMGFRQLMDSYPDSEISDDALYWIGETFMAQEMPDSARAIFLELEQEYPGSERIPTAMLKRGILLEENGQVRRATGLFMQVVERYPDSPEAEQASLRLENRQQ